MDTSALKEQFQTWRQDRRVKIGLIVVGAILLVYLAFGSWATKVQFANTQTKDAWLLVQNYSDSRAQMLPQFITLIQSYAPGETRMLEPLQGAYKRQQQWDVAREGSLNPEWIKEYVSLQVEVVNALKNMDTHAVNFPLISQNRQYQVLKMQLLAIEQQIAFSERILNREVKEYNALITGMLKSPLNRVFLHKSPVDEIHLDMAFASPPVPQ